MDAPVRCFHCGEIVGSDARFVEVDGAAAPMCCDGCVAAACFIRDAGLGDYYRLRQSQPGRAMEGADDFDAWLHPDVQARHASEVAGGREIVFVVSGMHCAACAWLIDRALSRQSGVLEVSANAVTGRVRLRWDPRSVALPALLRRLASLGFAPHLANGLAGEASRRASRHKDLLRLGVAALGALQAMMFAEALYLDSANQMPLATRDFLRWVTLLVSTPVVFYAGWPFLWGAWREVALRRPGMDLLVGTSILLAYLASFVETLRGGPHVWYDAAVMFVLLLLSARQLERWGRQRALARVDSLARARPALAWRERADGTRERIAASALVAGDIVGVDCGETLPADGTLIDPPRQRGAWLDEALITGEAEPVRRTHGDSLYAGTLCRDWPLRLRVTHTGNDTLLSDLERQLERAQAARPRLARTADRIAAWFVIVMLLSALGVGIAWWMIAPDRTVAIVLSVLAVSCPCALSLAVPAALAAAHGRLATLGVLALRPDALDALASVDVVVFDKTGTLTRGQPQLASCDVFGDITRGQAAALAAGLQAGSGHVLARAFDAGVATTVEQLTRVAGLGVEGRFEGRALRLGRADFAAAREDDGALWLGDGERALARFTVRDEARDDAAHTVAALRELGLAAEICSGDGHDAVARVAQTVGIDRFAARCLPDDKLARVRALQGAGHRVLMVGDGINDAPVLAGADVSFAIGSGAALAHRAADFVLVGDALARLPQAVLLARKSRRIVRQNFAWAVGYNLAALPAAALGLVDPWLAAVGMSASSLLVTLNALRLARDTA